MNEKIQKLARTIVRYSLNVQPNEKVLIEVNGEGTDDILKAIITETVQAKGVPYWNRFLDNATISLLKNGSENQIQGWAQIHRLVMENIDAYVSIRGSQNAYQFSAVSQESMKSYMKHYFEDVHVNIRVDQKKWVVLRWPNDAMAQLAQMETESFADFYFDTCNLDYSEMSRNMTPLVELMQKTSQVHLKNPETDIRFSIQNIPVVKCDGKRNIPDGEVYTAPVRDSMNGYIKYNAPSFYQGKLFSDIRFEVKNGKIIEATCQGDSTALQNILNTDEGARYFGEFAIGVNPFINTPMKDTLFDEKIYGSFHLTPGNSYKTAPNGNHSAVHWDLVQIQTPQYGGGEIWFDGKLIRKDGEFTLPELNVLNKPQK